MRGRRPALKAVSGGKSKPTALPRSTADETAAIVADLTARGLYAETMRPLIDAYVTSLWAIGQCRVALQKDGMFVKTKTGEPRAHPAAGMLSKNTEIVARLGAELGLTPAARSRKGLSGPEAPAGDDDAAALGL